MFLKVVWWEMALRFSIYLYVMHLAQGSMLLLGLSNKKKRIAPGFLYLCRGYEKA
jgi:small neutral amino acid transporter SnatA (MarC family)